MPPIKSKRRFERTIVSSSSTAATPSTSPPRSWQLSRDVTEQHQLHADCVRLADVGLMTSSRLVDKKIVIATLEVPALEPLPSRFCAMISPPGITDTARERWLPFADSLIKSALISPEQAANSAPEKFCLWRARSFHSSARNANQVSAHSMPRSIRSRKNVFAIANSKSAKLCSTKS